eukprot:gene17308-19041_t
MDSRYSAVSIILLITIGAFAKAHTLTTGCHEYCGKTQGTGTCESSDRCLCWWGFTGPNSTYVKAGSKKGRIQADHCEFGCSYNDNYRNPSCVDVDDDDSGSDCSDVDSD